MAEELDKHLDRLTEIYERTWVLDGDEFFKFIAPELIVSGLMKMSFQWLINPFVSLSCWRHNITKSEAWRRMYLIRPAIFEGFRYEFLNHLIYGHDYTSEETVGGFNDEELTMIEGIFDRYDKGEL